MKHTIRRISALMLTICLAITLCLPALAATVPNATIDYSAKGSISLYKYDLTTAAENGYLEGTYVATGLPDAAAEAALAAYAIEGVEYTYLNVASIETFTGVRDGVYTVEVQYGVTDSDFETLLGITGQASRTVGDTRYYNADVLNAAMASKLDSDKSAFKTALEDYISKGTAMPETDENGHSTVTDLPLGLYLIVETRVPENVSCTTAPWLMSIPMTTIDGAEWNYNLTVYPKNETDMPTLEKTLREDNVDTGKNEGKTDDITDGYADTATGSAGDVVDYQIISTLPIITSQASSLSTYTFVDTLSKGIEYNKNDVKIEWFKDAACTPANLVATWTEADNKFAVAYGTASDDATTMTVSMTASGLSEINTSTTIFPTTSKERGYSQLTMRITYAATVNSNADLVLGDEGNPNSVTLTWIRSNLAYSDKLTDDCHFYSYGVDLTKVFSDNAGDFANVNFNVHNDTDDYYVKAVLTDGIYFVTDHVATEAEATVFVPTLEGKIVVHGLEDDTYTFTETHTDDGYKLLAAPIVITITSAESDTVCTVCGSKYLTASATVDSNECTMLADGTSASALAALSVINYKEPEVPHTGDTGTWMLSFAGILLFTAALVYGVSLKKRSKEN